MRKQKRFPMLITLPSLPAGRESYGKYTTPDTPLSRPRCTFSRFYRKTSGFCRTFVSQTNSFTPYG